MPNVADMRVTATGAEASRSLADHLGDRFNVLNFGNAGTTTALVKAITACANAGGGVVDVPAGTWMISSKVTIPSYVKIKGAGMDATIFRAANGLNDHMFTTPDTETLWAGTSEDGAQYWGISDCTIDGNRTNQTQGAGIRTYSRAYEVKNIKFEYLKNKGFQSRWGDGPAYDDSDDRQFDLFMEAKIDNLFFQYCDEEGFWFDGPHDSRISRVICGLNSYSSHGSYAGFYTGPRAGGTQVSDCHSWGEYQERAYKIETPGICFANCYADDAYISLVHIMAANIKWVGGNVIGGYVNTPPSTQDKGLKGFTFSSAAYYPTIIANVVNCPGGAIDFTDVGNLGGFVHIFGHLDAVLQTANTGEQTYGYRGNIPASFWTFVRIVGVGNTFGDMRFPDSVSFADGTAAFPSVRRGDQVNTGIFFGSGKVGLAANGAEKLAALSSKIDIAVPIEFAPGASVTPTSNGDVVFELTSNTTLTARAKGSDGVVRSVALTLT